MEGEPRYDVVIVGGGPAGCATALALKQHGVAHILVVDAGHDVGRRIGESIPPNTRTLFRQLGVLQPFLDDAHEPCLGSCSSWGEDALGYNDFLLNPHGSGWHLDRRRFDVLLLDQVVASGVDVRRGERFAGCETTAGERRFRFVRSDSSVKTVRARYAVDASGPTAVLARGVGARRLFADRLFCAYGFFQLADSVSLPRLTMLEAVDVGWWYAARLPNREVVVALASDSETVRQFAASDATAWQALLRGTRHIGPALAESTWIEGSLRVAPAPSFVLDRTAGDGWLAAGDAASAYDPISAQGIYKALNDGLLAANAIVADLGGDAAALESYHASVKRRFEQYLVNRNYFYSIERRFPASPFWRRRQH